MELNEKIEGVYNGSIFGELNSGNGRIQEKIK